MGGNGFGSSILGTALGRVPCWLVHPAAVIHFAVGGPSGHNRDRPAGCAQRPAG